MSVQINRIIESPPVSSAKGGPILAIVLALLVAVLVPIFFSIADHPKRAATESPQASVEPRFARMILEFGSKGVAPGHFERAACIALDHQGHIYVGESDHGRVQVFDKTGIYLSEFLAGGFDDLVADRDGTVYVMSGGKICRFNGLNGTKLPDMERPSEDFAGQQTPVYYRCACLGPGVIHAVTGYAVDVPRVVTLNTTTGRVAGTVVVTTPPEETLNLRRLPPLAHPPIPPGRLWPNRKGLDGEDAGVSGMRGANGEETRQPRERRPDSTRCALFLADQRSLTLAS